MGKRVVAIVLAAGEGKRMGSNLPKQYMIIKSRPMIYHALQAFQESPVDEVILVTGEDEISYCQTYIVEKYGFTKVSKVIPGGNERFESVYEGLKNISFADYVLIHDGARPMIDVDLIRKCIYNVEQYPACVVGIPSIDTIKMVGYENYVESTPPRSKLWQVQTPQCFDYQLIMSAYEKLIQSGDRNITDDGMVVEKYGNVKVKLFEGNCDNIKITRPEDLRVVRNTMRARRLFRILHKIHDRMIYFQMILYKRKEGKKES